MFLIFSFKSIKFSMALQNRNAVSAENYYYEMQLGGR